MVCISQNSTKDELFGDEVSRDSFERSKTGILAQNQSGAAVSQKRSSLLKKCLRITTEAEIYSIKLKNPSKSTCYKPFLALISRKFAFVMHRNVFFNGLARF
jgi:hypothetical protein